MSANQIIVPQGWRYGMPIKDHYMRISRAEAKLLLTNGAIERVDVVPRLWRLRLAEICDSTLSATPLLSFNLCAFVGNGFIPSAA